MLDSAGFRRDDLPAAAHTLSSITPMSSFSQSTTPAPLAAGDARRYAKMLVSA